MINRTSLAALCLATALSGAAFAQQPSAPDAATLASARDVVAKMQGDKATVLQSMAAPLAALVSQMGVKEPERAQVLVGEVIVPTLSANYDALLDVQARSYASVLSAEDLRAVATFYNSPAGRNLAAAQPRLAQAQMTGMTQWMSGIAPELQQKLAAAIQKHGWGASPRKN